MENEKKGICFVSASEKQKNTCKERNSTYDNTEQKKIKEIVHESGLISLSASTVCRKLKKMKITRKRLTLVPAE